MHCYRYPDFLLLAVLLLSCSCYSSCSVAAAFCFVRQVSRIKTTGTRHYSHRNPTSLFYISSDDVVEDGSAADHTNRNQTSTLVATTASSSKEENTAGALSLQQQAAALRAEARSLERDLRSSIESKRQKELADIDRWIEHCLYVRVPTNQNSKGGSTATTTVELLNDVETTTQILRDERFSPEQVQKMFQRISDTSASNSRSNCSPLLALLVDAAGKLDTVDRQDNPNKRWNGRVERDLRKKLFAMDWGIHLETEKDDNTRFL